MEQNVKNQQKTESVDFESLLVKKQERDKLTSEEWSNCVIEDVRKYNGYIFTKKSDMNDSLSTPSYHIISKGKNPKDVIKNYYENPEVENHVIEHKTSQVVSPDGSVLYEDESYIYAEKPFIFIDLSTPTGEFTNTYKHDTNSLCSDIEYEKFQDMIGKNVKIKNTNEDKYYIKLKKVFPIQNKIIDYNILRLISFILMPIGVYLASLYLIISNIGYFTTGPLQFIASVSIISIILLVTVLSITSRFSNLIHKNIYYLSSDTSNLDKLPESAKIPEALQEDGSDYPESVVSTVQIENDGTITFNYKDITWTFESDDGLPSDKAEKIYKYFGCEIDNEINIDIEPYNEQEIVEYMYISDCENWIMSLNI